MVRAFLSSLPGPQPRSLCTKPSFHFLPGSLKLVTPEGAPAPGLRTPEIPMTEAVEAVGMCWMGGPRVKGGSSVTSVRVTGKCFLFSNGWRSTPGLLEARSSGVGSRLGTGRHFQFAPLPCPQPQPSHPLNGLGEALGQGTHCHLSGNCLSQCFPSCLFPVFSSLPAPIQKTKHLTLKIPPSQ